MPETWLFDAYPHPRTSHIVVWVKHGHSVTKRLIPYQPDFCIKAQLSSLEDAERILANDDRVETTWRDEASLWLRHAPKPVLHVRPKRLQDMHAIATDLRKKTHTKGFLFFDVDNQPESRWMHSQALFSMCRLAMDDSEQSGLRASDLSTQHGRHTHEQVVRTNRCKDNVPPSADAIGDRQVEGKGIDEVASPSAADPICCVEVEGKGTDSVASPSAAADICDLEVEGEPNDGRLRRPAAAGRTLRETLPDIEGGTTGVGRLPPRSSEQHVDPVGATGLGRLPPRSSEQHVDPVGGRGAGRLSRQPSEGHAKLSSPSHRSTVAPLRRADDEDRFTYDYPDPDLRTVHLAVHTDVTGNERGFDDPLLAITLDSSGVHGGGRTITLAVSVLGDDASERELLLEFKRRLDAMDPDVIFTRHGDRFDIPFLLHRISRLGLRHTVQLGRDTDPDPDDPDQKGKSIHTYGRWLYKTHAYYLRGRWHIDLSKKTLDSEDDRKDIQGILYLARVSNRRAQDVNRNGAGYALQQIQIDVATDIGTAIPWKRNLIEDWKDAATLCAVDRGGQIMVPTPGIYDDVVACDFSGYYPSLIVEHNLSSDTINCTCCRGDPQAPVVPELGMHVCRRSDLDITGDRGHQAYILGKLNQHRKEAKAVLRRARKEVPWLLKAASPVPSAKAVSFEASNEATTSPPTPTTSAKSESIPVTNDVTTRSPPATPSATSKSMPMSSMAGSARPATQSPQSAKPSTLTKSEPETPAEDEDSPSRASNTLSKSEPETPAEHEDSPSGALNTSSKPEPAKRSAHVQNITRSSSRASEAPVQARGLLPAAPCSRSESNGSDASVRPCIPCGSSRSTHLHHDEGGCGSTVCRSLSMVHPCPEGEASENVHGTTWKSGKKSVAPLTSDDVQKALAIKSEHKALGVVCFGYFRYRNARFGCAEVHQAIQCYGRDGMTRARRVAQDEGYQMVHSMTDCTFLQKPGVTRADALRLARRITKEVRVPMELEGIYRWVVFLPSKTHSTTAAGAVGVPNRYYGKFSNGSTKVRGIEVQRHSTPDWIHDTQQHMLDVLFEADDSAGFMARLPRALRIAKSAAADLRAGRVEPRDLGTMMQATKAVEEYRANTNTRAALLRLRDAGTERKPGEYVRYVVTRQDGPWESRVVPVELWDQEGWFGQGDGAYHTMHYLRLLARSVETILAPFGCDEESVLAWFLGQGARPMPPTEGRVDLPVRPEWVAS